MVIGIGELSLQMRGALMINFVELSTIRREKKREEERGVWGFYSRGFLEKRARVRSGRSMVGRGPVREEDCDRR
jgi:hypothetical protein